MTPPRLLYGDVKLVYLLIWWVGSWNTRCILVDEAQGGYALYAGVEICYSLLRTIANARRQP
jgi:hypothetical protein